MAILQVSLLPPFFDPERCHVALQELLLGLTRIAVGAAATRSSSCRPGPSPVSSPGTRSRSACTAVQGGTALVRPAVRTATERRGAVAALRRRPRPVAGGR
ncbi:hypothetical protein ACFV3R_33255 [Streptomyces sp. NPDC059740]|uniref:hypothetical protein n=1 Tax=Streptomyces sp. NPDC059740 TaxID=3346926 RepID=UPI0036533A29